MTNHYFGAGKAGLEFPMTTRHIGGNFADEDAVVNDKDKKRFDRQFNRIERGAPYWAARTLAFLRRPYARLIRIPLGILFVMGGIFSILPVLGLWMLPLGLLLLALDLPILQGPVGQWLIRLQRWWENRRRR